MRYIFSLNQNTWRKVLLIPISKKQFVLNQLYCKTEISDLIIVVFPTPGGPIRSKEAPSLIKSRSILALPETARPTRQVNPIIVPFRFLMELMRCRVRLMPARLSMAKSPTCHLRS